MTTNKYKEMFLDWFNNFISIERFAEYYNINTKEAELIIQKGRELHEKGVK